MSTTIPNTGSEFVDSFLKDYDRRINDDVTPAASTENLRRMRPAILLLAKNEPAKCETFIRNWIEKNIQ